jgi:hypothetical protein
MCDSEPDRVALWPPELVDPVADPNSDPMRNATPELCVS